MTLKLADGQAETPEAGAGFQQNQQKEAARVAQAPDTIEYPMTDITNADDDTSRQNRSPGSDRVRKDPQDNEMRQDRLLRHVRTDARTGQRTAALHLGCHAPR